MNIKRLIQYTIVLFLLSIKVAFSQNNITPDNPQYQILKESGMLPSHAGSSYTPQLQSPANYPIISPVIGGLQPKISTQCVPLITVDNSFTVVQFSNNNGPPDYRNDDGSTGLIALPFTFTFYGVNYNAFYINNNGNVTFNAAYNGFSAQGFPFAGNVMIAPFWADVDTRNPNSGIVYMKMTPTHVIIRWNNVGYFNSMADKLNDFQLILTNGSDPIIPAGTNAQMAYGDMQWTTGSASSGTNGFGGIAANVGANLGNNVNYIQFGQFNTNTSNYDGPFGADDGISWLDNKAFYFDLSDPANNNNVAPLCNGLAVCDTVDMCEGDTLNFNFSFLSPEQNQTTTITINSAAVPGFTGTFTPGNTASAVARFIPTNATTGYTTLLFNGTDNGIPSATTTVELVVNVIPKPQKPIITGDSVLCPGQTTLLTTQAGNINYLWSPGGSITNTQTNNGAGVYTVSYDSIGCVATSNPFTVIQVPNPVPTYSPPLSSCNSGTAFVIANQGYTSYTWLPSALTNDTVNLLPGAYTLTVIDTNGCTGSSIVNVSPISSITAALANSTPASCPQICDGIAQINTQNQLGALTYNWNPNVSTTAVGQNLCPGNYIVTVSDTAGCSDTVSFTLSSNYILATQVTPQNPLCFASCDGRIDITPQNGVAPYTYSWFPNNLTTKVSTTLCANMYSITTTDAAGCATTDTITLTNPPQLRVFASNTDETCPGFNDGSASLNINGGTPSYTIGWSSTASSFPPGNQLPDIANLCGGDYFYTVTDVNGCTETGTVEVNTIPKPVAAFSNSSVNADALDPTVIFVSASSADVTTWEWSFDTAGVSTLENPTILFPGIGSYLTTLIVTNNYGCRDTTNATIEIKDINVLYIPTAFTPNQDGLNDRFVPKGIVSSDLDYVMYIYNRWGERLFITNSLYEGWDGLMANGKECTEGLYLYKIVITNTKAETEEVFNGQLNLIR